MPALGESGEFALRLSTALAGRYEVVREHRRGGMATVYLAVDRKHDRQVALKVLDADLAAGIAAERFLREIEIAAHLTHPHILPLLDSGLVDGLPYYVMPFVEEESLRERLARVGPLPVDEALRIAHDVAGALAYAHGHDVIHRDIKPGNILLTEGGAVVTDFGIAVAMDGAADHLTRTGHSVGTAGYMSPEQASGDHDVDGRSDQYSLACVLFEMLTGDPPYTGRNARAILGRQLSQPVPEISALRDTVPEELSCILQRALARAPADRYPTMGTLADTLEGVGHRAAAGAAPAAFRTRPVVWTTLAAAILIATTAWFMSGIGGTHRVDSAPATPVDTSTYAIFPFEHLSTDLNLRERRHLRRALAGWKGISLIDDFQLGEALDRTGEASLDLNGAYRVARSLGAGRFLMGSVERIDDSVSVRTSLFQTDPGGPVNLADLELVLPLSGAGTDSQFAHHIVQLLWHGDPPGGPPTEVGTDVFPAWQAFEYGQSKIVEWDLAEAETGFTSAARLDPDYAEAHLWTALVRLWSGTERGAWGLAARQAAQRSAHLTKRDSAIAAAVVLQADGELGKACRTWDALTKEYPGHFTSWYGLALCLHSDRFVVADDASPSGWSYRSSPHRAIEAFEQAFLRLPAVLESFQADSYVSLQRLLLPSGHTTRPGYALPPDTIRFRAYPAWVDDTLAFVPRPLSDSDVRTRDVGGDPWRDAVQWQRRKFREIAAAWAGNAPGSAAAREALAVALALHGDASALDTLLRARTLADQSADAYRMAAAEVWLRIAFGLPDDRAQLEHARALADSLVEVVPANGDIAAGLAVITGRGALAARYARGMPSLTTPGPRGLTENLAALLVFSSLGGPADSLDRLARRVIDEIEAGATASERADLYAWLGLPASLAFPAHPLPGRERIPADWLVEAQAAAESGDTSAVRQALGTLGTGRIVTAPYSRTLDALYAEAALWAAIGELEIAVKWLEPTLSVLPQVPNPLPYPWQAASLVRAMALRADLASQLGDPREANSWARAVTILWSDADPFHQPLVDRMRRLAQCTSC